MASRKTSTKGAGGRGGHVRKKAVRQPVKAGLQFPVNRIGRHLKKGCYAQCISSIALVYLAVVLEYLASEVLEFVGNAAIDNKKKRIIPRHLMLAVRNGELDKLFHRNFEFVKHLGLELGLSV
ncbi:Histone H2A.1 [Bienertia sinuspersici]